MDNCGDNRFEIIGKAKQDLLKSTNIDSSKDEMKVLDNFLFRCWQMGWLNQYNLTSDAEGEELLTCEKYKVEEALNYCDELDSISGSHNMLNWGKQIIAYLFGSKCLLDAHEDSFTSIEPKPAEQSMTDSETEHTKDEFATRMQGKFTEQDFTEAKQRAESSMASIPQLELPKPIETQIDEAMAGIEAEAQRQYGNFGAAGADITIPVYRQMMRLGALLALSAGYLESEQTDSDRGDYISMT